MTYVTQLCYLRFTCISYLTMFDFPGEESRKIRKLSRLSILNFGVDKGCSRTHSANLRLCISQFRLRPCPPRANPRALAFFFSWMANSPGVGTLKLPNNAKHGILILHRQHYMIVDCYMFENSSLVNKNLHIIKVIFSE